MYFPDANKDICFSVDYSFLKQVNKKIPRDFKIDKVSENLNYLFNSVNFFLKFPPSLSSLQENLIILKAVFKIHKLVLINEEFFFNYYKDFCILKKAEDLKKICLPFILKFRGSENIGVKASLFLIKLGREIQMKNPSYFHVLISEMNRELNHSNVISIFCVLLNFFKFHYLENKPYLEEALNSCSELISNYFFKEEEMDKFGKQMNKIYLENFAIVKEELDQKKLNCFFTSFLFLLSTRKNFQQILCIPL